VLFLVDARLPPALARTLREAGHQAEHLKEAGLRHAKDPVIWDYARRHAAIVITKDEDFVDRYRRPTGECVVLWLRLGKASTRRLLAWFTPLFPQLISRLEARDRFIEVR
jgi:predicted nuclease of predicted toxin-antitoxin system